MYTADFAKAGVDKDRVGELVTEDIEVEEKALADTGEEPAGHPEHADSEVDELLGAEEVHPEGAAIGADQEEGACGDDTEWQEDEGDEPADHALPCAEMDDAVLGSAFDSGLDGGEIATSAHSSVGALFRPYVSIVKCLTQRRSTGTAAIARAGSCPALGW